MCISTRLRILADSAASLLNVGISGSNLKRINQFRAANECCTNGSERRTNEFGSGRVTHDTSV